MTLSLDDPRHGTNNGYRNFGCRCDACRSAGSLWYREYVKGPCPGCGGTLSNRYAHKLCDSCQRATVAESKHGTEARYTSYKCRCDECRAAGSAAKRRRRERSRIPCSTCGTPVDGINRSNPDKPPECRSCAVARVNSQRRMVAA